MSAKAIKKALETAMKNLGGLPIAWANVNFAPPEGAYQEVDILFAEPENPSMGDDFHRQSGYMQVKLQYPLNVGAGDAITRAQLLRDTFKRGLSLVADGVTTVIERTPEIAPGAKEGDRYVVNVRIRFYANITGA